MLLAQPNEPLWTADAKEPHPLDDLRWPAIWALIDEACGLIGNGVIVAEGPKDDLRVRFVGLYYRGERREDLERCWRS